MYNSHINNKIVLTFHCLFFLISCFLLFVSPALSQEQITITAYYPVDYGRYRELRADRASVGAGYRNAALNPGDFIVEGPVGIGTPAPGVFFEIVDATSDQGTMLSISGYDNDDNLPYDIVALADEDTNSDFVIRAQAAGDVRAGINTAAPSDTLDVQGNTNICVRRSYRQDTGVTPCSAGYYITLVTAVAPDPGPPPAELTFLCCRFCDDNNLDGVCD